MPEKFYITTSIAYTNAIPHIGFALESLQADALARYHSQLGEETFFLTGTDEHGSKIAKEAEKAGQDPKSFVDKISHRFSELKSILNLSNNYFIRTTDEKKHWPSVKKIWEKLVENKDIYKKEYRGLYCVGCEAFLTRKDLIDGKCAVHQKEPEAVNEENYFFRLSKYGEQIKEAIVSKRMNIVPESRANEMLSFLDQGLEDVSFSRPRKDLRWGFPVPNDDSHTIYVWADALTNYISALGYDKESKLFNKFWPADVHCLGKDILRFHALIWPGILLSAGLSLPKNILVHGHIMSGGQKMSKSLGNVVDPFELVKKYGTDAVRYFLLREISTTEDGDFTIEKFEERYNADLAGGIGNLLSRVLTVAEKIDSKNDKLDPDIQKEIKAVKDKYHASFKEYKITEAIKAIWELISYCDRYIEQQKPWQTKDPKTINSLLACLKEISLLLEPILPETAEKISKQVLQRKKGEQLFKKLVLDIS
ncbi:class I tRNA ligase family protein [Patescibacteria group bacterium]|nr:class I tRNA ligase family protein [Patescibacteria group bacterium]